MIKNVCCGVKEREGDRKREKRERGERREDIVRGGGVREREREERGY